MTETELVFKRNQLRHLMVIHAKWTGKQLAGAVGMSEGGSKNGGSV